MNFPIFDRLTISGYGLYPGPSEADPGLRIEFMPGLTLVVGANGLGKSTLVGILFRLLTGPYDISGLSGRTELGNTNLTPTRLSPATSATFANRVVDGARSASAELRFILGARTVVVSRRLNDLTLVAFSVDGQPRGVSEDTYQAEISALVGVWSFGDWILLLRHLVFYFEDRRSLVWDPSAQRQILRFLFLAPEPARKWSEDEREILQLDSRARNLSAALTREARALSKSEVKSEQGVDVRRELQTLEKLNEIDDDERARLEDQVAEVDSGRQVARLRFMKAEQEHESRFRELERARLTAISARFPTQSETARYILAQLMTEHRCVVCGHDAPDASVAYMQRIETNHCVVCGSDVSGGDRAHPTELADKRVEKTAEELEAAARELFEARRTLEEAEKRHQLHFTAIQELNLKLAERSARIDGLIQRLPPAEADLHKQRHDLASMRARVGQLQEELTAKRQLFKVFVDDTTRQVAAKSNAVKIAFDAYAEGFLLEMCHLTWSPHRTRLGESGETFEFPAFELELSGTDFPSPVRRTGPDQVSESQREFIDLAFRMALIATAGETAAGTLVIDAPESSLDAVFVTRAATVLSRFADPAKGNRLMVTSNLVEGQLIPALLAKAAPKADRGERIVDLFAIATPTAAIRQLKDEYDRVRQALFDGAHK
ncbi:MAG: AAA family ATPase [Vicinamibacterales bacterium]